MTTCCEQSLSWTVILIAQQNNLLLNHFHIFKTGDFLKMSQIYECVYVLIADADGDTNHFQAAEPQCCVVMKCNRCVTRLQQLQKHFNVISFFLSPFCPEYHQRQCNHWQKSIGLYIEILKKNRKVFMSLT